MESNTLIGLRDRALIGTMVYSFARFGAAVTMKVGDYFQHLDAGSDFIKAAILRGEPTTNLPGTLISCLFDLTIAGTSVGDVRRGESRHLPLAGRRAGPANDRGQLSGREPTQPPARLGLVKQLDTPVAQQYLQWC
jgi:hypothetical protein